MPIGSKGFAGLETNARTLTTRISRALPNTMQNNRRHLQRPRHQRPLPRKSLQKARVNPARETTRRAKGSEDDHRAAIDLLPSTTQGTSVPSSKSDNAQGPIALTRIRWVTLRRRKNSRNSELDLVPHLLLEAEAFADSGPRPGPVLMAKDVLSIILQKTVPRKVVRRAKVRKVVRAARKVKTSDLKKSRAGSKSLRTLRPTYKIIKIRETISSEGGPVSLIRMRLLMNVSPRMVPELVPPFWQRRGGSDVKHT